MTKAPRLGPAVLVDTAVLAYALGGKHELRDPCQDLVRAAGDGHVDFHASVEMIQELVFHRMRRGERVAAVDQARDAARLCVLHAFDRAVLDAALELVRSADSLGGRDAVHAATALVHGIEVIISPDRAFDGIAGLSRLAPSDAVQWIRDAR